MLKNNKDFDRWNEIKKGINNKNKNKFFHEREIWWCSLGLNIGSEQDGKGDNYLRPILIYKRIDSSMFIGIPLTTVLKEDNIHVSFYFNYDISTALIFQIRSFDKKRLVQRIGRTSIYVYNKIKKAVKAFVS